MVPPGMHPPQRRPPVDGLGRGGHEVVAAGRADDQTRRGQHRRHLSWAYRSSRPNPGSRRPTSGRSRAAATAPGRSTTTVLPTVRSVGIGRRSRHGVGPDRHVARGRSPRSTTARRSHHVFWHLSGGARLAGRRGLRHGPAHPQAARLGDGGAEVAAVAAGADRPLHRTRCRRAPPRPAAPPGPGSRRRRHPDRTRRSARPRRRPGRRRTVCWPLPRLPISELVVRQNRIRSTWSLPHRPRRPSTPRVQSSPPSTCRPVWRADSGRQGCWSCSRRPPWSCRCW